MRKALMSILFKIGIISFILILFSDVRVEYIFLFGAVVTVFGLRIAIERDIEKMNKKSEEVRL